MNSLDRLAYSAAEAIDGSVARVPVPTWGAGAGSAFADIRRTLGYALAGATAAVLAVAALLLVGPPVEESTDITPATVVVTTVPTTVPLTIDNTVPTTTPLLPDNVVPIPIPDGQERTVQADIDPPDLAIVSPKDGAHLQADRVVVEGRTEIGARLATTDGWRISVDSEGRWSHVVALAVGENRLGFVATDAAGNQTYAGLVVVRDAPPTTTTTQPRPKQTTTTTKGRTWDFSAHNTYGTCAEDPPYDVYHGTGKPGTEISISSEFGGATTIVRENGSWEITVFFPSAPFDVKFQVKVNDFNGDRRIFDFTRLTG